MTLKPPFSTAFNALQALGAPVYEHADDFANFSISAEENDEETWADYYDAQGLEGWEFGVNPKITEILRANGLFAEWVNPGRLAVYLV